MKTLTKMSPGIHTGFLVVCAAFLAGCGSSGSSTATGTGTTNTFKGTATQSSATTTTAITVPATGGTRQTVTVGGVSVTATVPSGAANAAAGSTLAVVNSGSTLLGGTFPAGSSVMVNGVSNSGVTIDSTGAIAQNVALPIDAVNGSDYALGLPQGSIQTRALTVAQTTFSGRFYIRGGAIVSPLPIGVAGTFPSNGQNAAGSLVTATFGAGNDGRTVTLTVNYGNGFVLKQTQIIKSSVVTFRDIATDASATPAAGISTLSLAVGL